MRPLFLLVWFGAFAFLPAWASRSDTWRERDDGGDEDADGFVIVPSSSLNRSDSGCSSRMATRDALPSGPGSLAHDLKSVPVAPAATVSPNRPSSSSSLRQMSERRDDHKVQRETKQEFVGKIETAKDGAVGAVRVGEAEAEARAKKAKGDATIALYTAIAASDVKALGDALDNGADINFNMQDDVIPGAVCRSGKNMVFTPLMAAMAMLGAGGSTPSKMAIIRALLDRGADVNLIGRWCHFSTLKFAVVMCREMEPLELILSKGPNVNAIGPEGKTVFEETVAAAAGGYGPREMILKAEMLFAKGATASPQSVKIIVNSEGWMAKLVATLRIRLLAASKQ
jgi:hypothetical protein